LGFDVRTVKLVGLRRDVAGENGERDFFSAVGVSPDMS